MKCKSALINISISVVSLFAAIFALEVVARTILFFSPNRPVNSLCLFVPDPALGVNNASEQSWSINNVTFGGKHIYQATYHTDKFSRRTVNCPSSNNSDQYSDNLILLGDSLTFSTGLNDAESLQCQLSYLLPNSNVVNYAVPGFGPSQIYRQVQIKKFDSEIPPLSRNVVVLTFIAPHFARVTGSTQNPGIPNSPYYETDDSLLKYYKQFSDAHPYAAFFYRLGSKLSTFRLFRIAIPWRLEKSAVRTSALLIAGMKQEILTQFGNSARFYVLLHPGFRDGLETEMEELRAQLIKSQIQLIEPKCPDNDCLKLQIPLDGHPNELGSKFLAHSISAGIKQN